MKHKFLRVLQNNQVRSSGGVDCGFFRSKVYLAPTDNRPTAGCGLPDRLKGNSQTFNP